MEQIVLGPSALTTDTSETGMEMVEAVLWMLSFLQHRVVCPDYGKFCLSCRFL